MKNSLRIHKWTHNEFNIFILGVLTHPHCYFSLLTTQYFNPQEPALPNHNLLSMNLTAEPIIVV